jgi:hypothetical protein
LDLIAYLCLFRAKLTREQKEVACLDRPVLAISRSTWERFGKQDLVEFIFIGLSILELTREWKEIIF